MLSFQHTTNEKAQKPDFSENLNINKTKTITKTNALLEVRPYLSYFVLGIKFKFKQDALQNIFHFIRSKVTQFKKEHPSKTKI